MASLSDVSDADLKKLAGYLKRFPSDDDEAEQFWYQLACVLRRRRGNTYNYSEQVRVDDHNTPDTQYCVQFLVDVGQTEDKAAWVFLKDLRGRGIQLDDLVQCLKTINCHQALRLFEPGEASECISPLYMLAVIILVCSPTRNCCSDRTGATQEFESWRDTAVRCRGHWCTWIIALCLVP